MTPSRFSGCARFTEWMRVADESVLFPSSELAGVVDGSVLGRAVSGSTSSVAGHEPLLDE